MKHGLAKAWAEADRREREALVQMDALYWELARALGEEWRPGAHESRTMFRDGASAGTWFKVRVCRTGGGQVLVLVSRSFARVGDIQCPVQTVEKVDAGGVVAQLREWGAEVGS